MGESRSGRSDPDGDSRGGRAHCKRRRRDNRHQAATRPDIERQPCLSVCLNLRKLAQTGDVHIVSMTRNRGLNDILIVSSMDCAAFRMLPNRLSQHSGNPAVHLIRNSLAFAHWKERKSRAAPLKPIDPAANTDRAQAALEENEKSEWGGKFPVITQMCRRQWEQVIPFFAM